MGGEELCVCVCVCVCVWVGYFMAKRFLRFVLRESILV
jgi:hypothetical protein